MRLNLGAGRDVGPEWVNVDRVALPGIDVVADLDAGLPFAPDTVEHTLLSHTIEHLAHPLALMEQLWHATVVGGTCEIRVPHGASDDAWEDPTHVRAYFPASFGYFSQPFYWRADYGYRGDWRCDRIIFDVRPGEGRIDLLARINTDRNVVVQMTAELSAVKPPRAPRAELQDRPRIGIRQA